MTKFCFGYARYSSFNQSDGMTLEAQERSILNHFKTVKEPEGFQWIELVTDPCISATRKRFRQRPGGICLNRVVQTGDHIIIAHLDRIFRNSLDFLTNFEDWDRRGVTFNIVSMGVDTSSPHGRLMLKQMLLMAASFAEFEAGMLGERMKAVHANLRAKGRRYALHAPSGFRCYHKPDGHVYYKRHEDDIKVLCWIFRQAIQGATHWHIANELNKRSVPRYVLVVDPPPHREIIHSREFHYEVIPTGWTRHATRDRLKTWMKVCKQKGWNPATGEEIPKPQVSAGGAA